MVRVRQRKGRSGFQVDIRGLLPDGTRYRERVKSRKPPQPEAVSEHARVITPEHFFRAHVRPAGMLRALRAAAAKSFAALLFARMPAGAGAGAATGAALATSTHLSQTY